MKRILFVCTGNTCRSVLAEYLGHKFCSETFAFESAGINPQPAVDAFNTVSVLQHTFGIDASGHQPRDVRSIDLNVFDRVVAIENNAAAILRDLGVPESKLQVWSIQDPWGGDPTEYESVALDIRRRLFQLKQETSHEALPAAK